MTFAWDYTSCHAAISTLLMILANNVQKLARSLVLNPIDHLLELSKRKFRARPLKLNTRELTRAAIPQVQQ